MSWKDQDDLVHLVTVYDHIDAQLKQGFLKAHHIEAEIYFEGGWEAIQPQEFALYTIKKDVEAAIRLLHKLDEPQEIDYEWEKEKKRQRKMGGFWGFLIWLLFCGALIYFGFSITAANEGDTFFKVIVIGMALVFFLGYFYIYISNRNYYDD